MATLTYICVLLVLCLCVGQLMAQEGRARFAYDGIINPEKWADLSPQYALCARGTRQSPIDIARHAAVADPDLKPLGSLYNPGSATLIDNGFNVMLKYGEEVGVIVIDGKNYKLQQLHWHSPSEHTIDGVRYPVELHLVHVSEDGNISVVAVLYKYGHADPFSRRPSKRESPRERDRGSCECKSPHTPHKQVLSLRWLLTTPPCTEGVTWNILGKVKQISPEQANSLTSLLEDDCRHNARPVQPLHGRRVLLCHKEV
ncbi:alpha carbonic anhydrase 1, chloroplastic-like [Wolffia australiana]